jgi:hypothetical protein
MSEQSETPAVVYLLGRQVGVVYGRVEWDTDTIIAILNDIANDGRIPWYGDKGIITSAPDP